MQTPPIATFPRLAHGPTARLTDRQRRAAAAVAVAVSLAGSGSAEAAGPRPLFQMPVPCAQTWEISTYKTHGPDPDSIDMAQRTPSNGNITEGEPVLASADGKVEKVYTHPKKKEHRVVLDHGDGWKTRYYHLKVLPQLAIGRRVAQGEVIGTNGKSGTESPHLHYSQMRDGKAVRVYFDGKPVDTHAGNPDGFGTYGKGNAERITSRNCSGDALARLGSADSKRGLHLFAYHPDSGAAGISRLKSNATGVTNVWSGAGQQRWTHQDGVNLAGIPHLIRYKASNGAVQFGRLRNDAQGLEVGTKSWAPGWTHFMPFRIDHREYRLAYDSLHGYANIDVVEACGCTVTNVSKATWSTGWTHLVAFRQGGLQFYIAYKASTGAVKVSRLRRSEGIVKAQTVWSGTWSKNWSHIVAVPHKGEVHVLFHRARTGLVRFGKIRSRGKRVKVLGGARWSKGWTAFTPFAKNGTGYVHVYKNGSGTARIVRLKADGSGATSMGTQQFTRGLT